MSADIGEPHGPAHHMTGTVTCPPSPASRRQKSLGSWYGDVTEAERTRRLHDVADLIECTSLDIYDRLPAAELSPETSDTAYMVSGVANGHRGLMSYPDQETTVALGGGRMARHAVCLHPDETEARAQFHGRVLRRRRRGGAKASEAAGGRVVGDGDETAAHARRRRWWW